MPPKGKSAQGKVGGKKGAYNKSGYQSKRPVGGAGIFVTCVRGKEGACVGQFYDLLEETAARHWSKERLAQFEEQRLVKKATADSAGAQPTEAGGDAAEEEEEEEMEVVNEPESEEEEEDGSIEASIARELEELKNAKTVRRRTPGGGGGAAGAKKGDKPKVKPRFLSLETGVECLLFFALAWPYDPVEMVHAIVTDLLAGEASRTKYILRLEPVSNTCSALNLNTVPTISSSIIRKAFQEYSAKHSTTNITYAIDTQIRCHLKPLSREYLLKEIGAVVRDVANPPSPSSDPTAPATTSDPSSLTPDKISPALTVSANLSSPNLIIILQVLRNVYGVAVMDGELWKGRGRKFNCEQICLGLLTAEREERDGEKKMLEEGVDGGKAGGVDEMQVEEGKGAKEVAKSEVDTKALA